MYTEIKEAVNFIAAHLLVKIPRRPVSLFTEHLANHLVLKFSEHNWNPENPELDEQHRVIQFNAESRRDQRSLISICALTVGLEVTEVLECLPDKMLLYTNPGSVFFRTGENNIMVPIWVTGDMTADDNYSPLPDKTRQAAALEQQSGSQSNMGGAAKTVYIGRGRNAVENADMTDMWVPLKLNPRLPGESENPFLKNELNKRSMKTFEYTPRDHLTLTVEQFAVTRFGSHKQRPDHDMMKDIQKRAAISAAFTPLERLHDGPSNGRLSREHKFVPLQNITNYTNNNKMPMDSMNVLNSINLNPEQMQVVMNVIQQQAAVATASSVPLADRSSSHIDGPQGSSTPRVPSPNSHGYTHLPQYRRTSSAHTGYGDYHQQQYTPNTPTYPTSPAASGDYFQFTASGQSAFPELNGPVVASSVQAVASSTESFSKRTWNERW